MPRLPLVVLLAGCAQPPAGLTELPAAGLDLVRGTIDGDGHTLLVKDGRILADYRERDEVDVRVLTGVEGDEFVMVTVDSGGPGTCVWHKQLRAYVIDESIDGTPELLELQSVPLGGYAACSDGENLSCGCGTWEATWDVTEEDGRLRLTTTPVFRDADPRGVLPEATSVTLPP